MLKKFGKSTSVKFYSELFKQSRNALKNGKANNPLEVFVESESQSGFASRIKVRDFEFCNVDFVKLIISLMLIDFVSF